MLRHRDVRTFLLARFTSLIGNTIAPIALAFAVLDVSDSAAALGLVLAARSIPNVVFLLVGGVVADRLPRHLVIVTANTVCFVTQVLAATLLVSGHAQIWQLVVIEAVNGAAAAFSMPAMAGILAAIVPRDQLPQAAAVSGFARSVALVGGGAVAGVIVGFVGPAAGLFIDAASFGVAAVLMRGLRLPPIERGPSTMLRDLREGWTEFVARQWVWVIVVAFGLLNATWAACWLTLGPVIADDSFGRTGWGIASAAFGAGLIVGGIVMIRLKPLHPLRIGMFGILAQTPALVCLVLAPHTIPVAAAAFVSGIGVECFGIGWESSVSQHVPTDKLSRVFSYDMLGSFIAIPVGQLSAGYLAGALGVRAVELWGALVYGALALATVVVPSVWTLRRLDAPQDFRATPQN